MRMTKLKASSIHDTKLLTLAGKHHIISATSKKLVQHTVSSTKVTGTPHQEDNKMLLSDMKDWKNQEVPRWKSIEILVRAFCSKLD